MSLSTILLSVAAGMATGAPVPPPSYTAAGSLTDPNGAPVYPAWVGAYDAESGSLLQIVDVEPSGSYVIPGLPRTVQLLAKPYFGSPLAAQWLFDQDLSTTQTESFELEIGAPVTFTLRDRQGNPVEGAEVRAYPAQAHRLDGKGIIDFALTDANGTATIIAPTFSHLVADGSQLGYLPSWRFNRRLSTAGTSLDFTIDVGTPVTGKVYSSDFQPLEDIAVSGWSYTEGWHWTGLHRTNATGSYSTLAGERYTRLQATDPSHQRVSGRAYRNGPGGGQMPDITLLDGVPLEIQTKDDNDAPVRSKIWAYAHATRHWVLLGYSDDGVLNTVVPSIYHLHVRPVDSALVARGLHNEVATEPGTKTIVHPRGHSVAVTVTDTSGSPIHNVDVRSKMPDGIWLGTRRTDALGKADILVAPSGISEIRIWDRAHGSALERKVVKFNGTSDGEALSVTLNANREVTGELRGRDGDLILEPMRVYTRSAQGWQSRITETGTFSVPTADRYHLRVVPVDSESTYFPSWHWHNVLPSDGVHSRGPVILTRGYHAEVQVVATDNGNAPVAGVRVVGGHPRQVSGSDGWVKTLLPPVYRLRNYPPGVSPSNPNPIVPDRFRAHTSIESERTRASGGPLDPIEVFTQLGTIASGRVTGPLPGGGHGPLPGIRVTSHGGRRGLGSAVTNADGRFHVLGIKYDSEYEFKTSFVVRPRHGQPYLPDLTAALPLETVAGSGTNLIGDIEISAAAYGTGVVVDPFGEPIDDRTVSFRARRKDRRPRWRIGRGRIDSSTGEFLTKVATRTTLEFWTRFWNQGWYRKWFADERTFEVGEAVDLGDFQLGQAPIVEFRAMTSVASAGGHASPVPKSYVELIRISDGKVMDYGWTDAGGDLQLRGPENEPLKLRFSFFVYSYWILGVPFDPVFSEEFEPQETDPFTLTGQGQVTNLGDLYILSPVRARAQEVIAALQNADASAFISSVMQDALVLAASQSGHALAVAEGMTETAAARATLLDSGYGYAALIQSVLNESIVVDPAVRVQLSLPLTEVLSDILLLLNSLEQ